MPNLPTGVHVDERLDAVGETHDASHALVSVVEGISLDPSDHPVDIGVPRHEPRDAEALASAARYLVVRVVDVYAPNLADLAAVDHGPELPELRQVAPCVPGREGNSSRTARLDHPVGLLEAGCYRLLAEDRTDAGLRAGYDDLGIRADGQDGSGDVNLLVGQEVFVAFVDGRDAESLPEAVEVPPVGVGGGDQLASRVQLVATGMIRAHPSNADHRYLVFWGRHSEFSFRCAGQEALSEYPSRAAVPFAPRVPSHERRLPSSMY